MQHLLSRACQDADGVRDDLRGYVTEHLGDLEGMLVVDETGDLKKGASSAGVQRQYSGTAGRVENCQVAVCLTYAAPGGHALIGRELYLPGSWVTGDEVYGASPGLRPGLEERRMSYVLAVAESHPVTTAAGAVRADLLATRLPLRAWQRLPAGPGAKGDRWYDWAWAAIDAGMPGHRHLLVRRHRRTGELACYRCCAARHISLAARVRAAGRRWTAEEDFQAGKGLAALDEHQVRTWTSWYRWVTLAMLALAFLTITALTGHAQSPPAGLPRHWRPGQSRTRQNG